MDLAKLALAIICTIGVYIMILGMGMLIAWAEQHPKIATGIAAIISTIILIAIFYFVL